MAATELPIVFISYAHRDGRDLAARLQADLVIPVRVQRDCDVPLSLQIRQYIDFSDADNYAPSLEQLVMSIRERRGAVAPVENQPRYNNAPPLPENYVNRPELLAQV